MGGVFILRLRENLSVEEVACMRSLMAFFAVCLFFYIKGPFAVVADTAELALGNHAHIHLVGTLFHLEHMVVAGTAFFVLSFNMRSMTEEHRFSAIRFEGHIASTHTAERSAPA
jgi:hypothetical protein